MGLPALYWAVVMRKTLLVLASAFLLACGGASEDVETSAVEESAKPLEIYWIDVEGGGATLIVTPEGETVLMDAGYPGNDDRDAKRIEHVLEHEVGRKELDYFITSHYHGDHSGGLPGLAALVPIKQFVDHGLPPGVHQSANRFSADRHCNVARRGHIEHANIHLLSDLSRIELHITVELALVNHYRRIVFLVALDNKAIRAN